MGVSSICKLDESLCELMTIGTLNIEWGEDEETLLHSPWLGDGKLPLFELDEGQLKVFPVSSSSPSSLPSSSSSSSSFSMSEEKETLALAAGDKRDGGWVILMAELTVSSKSFDDEDDDEEEDDDDEAEMFWRWLLIVEPAKAMDKDGASGTVSDIELPELFAPPVVVVVQEEGDRESRPKLPLDPLFTSPQVPLNVSCVEVECKNVSLKEIINRRNCLYSRWWSSVGAAKV